MSINLAALLTGQVFAFMMVFARLGATFMLLPGIGEPYVPARARLFLALGFALLILPVVGGQLPAMPEQPASLVRLFFVEITVGIFFGTVLRFLLAALEIAGTFISFESGLSNASLFNPAFATHGTMPGALISTVGVLLLFITGLEDSLLAGLVGTYDVFVPGKELVIGDLAGTIARVMSQVFLIGAQIAVPFFLIALLTYVPVGVISRLVPQLQVLIVMLPIQVGMGLILFGLTVSAGLMFWLQQFESTVHGLLLR